MSQNNTNSFIFKKKKPIMVFDASSLITGIDLYQIGKNSWCFTSFSIFEEEVKNKFVKDKIKSFIIGNLFFLAEAPSNYYQKIKELATKSGDLKSLSSNDIGILALGLYLYESYLVQFNSNPDFKIITDDYSIQNVAMLQGIESESYRQNGIKKYIEWEIYCPACFKIYSPNFFKMECLICGEIVKRRPKKR